MISNDGTEALDPGHTDIVKNLLDLVYEISGMSIVVHEHIPGTNAIGERRRAPGALYKGVALSGRQLGLAGCEPDIKPTERNSDRPRDRRVLGIESDDGLFRFVRSGVISTIRLAIRIVVLLSRRGELRELYTVETGRNFIDSLLEVGQLDVCLRNGQARLTTSKGRRQYELTRGLDLRLDRPSRIPSANGKFRQFVLRFARKRRRQRKTLHRGHNKLGKLEAPEEHLVEVVDYTTCTEAEQPAEIGRGSSQHKRADAEDGSLWKDRRSEVTSAKGPGYPGLFEEIDGCRTLHRPMGRAQEPAVRASRSVPRDDKIEIGIELPG
ncbi:hypothetical protein SCE1572_07980 [Sorangium cellulosum So0157-2]|uniref:Uncharacterized protein n=1 Tax=Sorangium cellulosum So0157-2 TaxID=1254432 RepID=S4XMT3_SORCE|nr:hypothetical protein SCE1572_07980 [Sorangium cellulosum So0157-2]